MVLEKTLASPLDCKENKPLHPKGNQPEYSLEGLMLEPRLQYFGHLIRRADSLEKTLMLGPRLQYFGHLLRRTDSLEKILMLGKRLKAAGEGDDRG